MSLQSSQSSLPCRRPCIPWPRFSAFPRASASWAGHLRPWSDQQQDWGESGRQPDIWWLAASTQLLITSSGADGLWARDIEIKMVTTNAVAQVMMKNKIVLYCIYMHRDDYIWQLMIKEHCEDVDKGELITITIVYGPK